MIIDPDIARKIEAFYIAHRIGDAAHRTVISHLLVEPPRPAIEGALRARGWAKLTCKSVLPLSEYEAAVLDLVERDLVWTIDSEKLSLIDDYLQATPALGPTQGMPRLGTLQISIRFANLLDELRASFGCEPTGANWSLHWISQKHQVVYSATRNGCLDYLRGELTEDDEGTFVIQHLAGPSPCGPWRRDWWRKYNSGYTLEIHYA